MTWNYRIIDYNTHRALHEVYYDPQGRPVAYTSNPVRFCVDADDADNAIIEQLRMAIDDALFYPILHVDTFKLPVGERPVAPRRNKE